MRTLDLNEVHTVTGAGYSPSVSSVASSIMVAERAAAYASGAVSALGAGLAFMGGETAFGLAVTTLTRIVAPAVGFPAAAAALLVLDPDLRGAVKERFHHFFG